MKNHGELYSRKNKSLNDICKNTVRLTWFRIVVTGIEPWQQSFAVEKGIRLNPEYTQESSGNWYSEVNCVCAGTGVDRVLLKYRVRVKKVLFSECRISPSCLTAWCCWADCGTSRRRSHTGGSGPMGLGLPICYSTPASCSSGYKQDLATFLSPPCLSCCNGFHLPKLWAQINPSPALLCVFQASYHSIKDTVIL